MSDQSVPESTSRVVEVFPTADGAFVSDPVAGPSVARWHLADIVDDVITEHAQRLQHVYDDRQPTPEPAPRTVEETITDYVDALQRSPGISAERAMLAGALTMFLHDVDAARHAAADAAAGVPPRAPRLTATATATAEPDPRFTLGAPDWTPDAAPWCDAATPDPNDPNETWLCTRHPDHEGRHVAGDGNTVVAVWV